MIRLAVMTKHLYAKNAKNAKNSKKWRVTGLRVYLHCGSANTKSTLVLNKIRPNSHPPSATNRDVPPTVAIGDDDEVDTPPSLPLSCTLSLLLHRHYQTYTL